MREVPSESFGYVNEIYVHMALIVALYIALE